MDKVLFQKYHALSEQQWQMLRQYVDVLQHWNQRINLVGRSTIDNIWQRHILDCSALKNHINNPDQCIIDFGSGAGFPGLVLSILCPNPITLIEATGKKIAFLQEVKHQLGLNCTILHRRIEQPPTKIAFDLVMARALSDLTTLWRWSILWRKPSGCCILLKGQQVAEEVAILQENFPEVDLSITDHPFNTGCIVTLRHKQYIA